MPGFKGLFVPGPTNMPFRVRQAMDVALGDHRAPDFPHFTLPLLRDLKKVFQTRQRPRLPLPVAPAPAAGSRPSPIRSRPATRC